MPKYGRAVYASLGEAVAATGQRQAEAQRRWEDVRWRWLRRVGQAFGLVHGVFGASWCRDMLAGSTGADRNWLSVAALGTVGTLLVANSL